jgi:hypothetical protein
MNTFRKPLAAGLIAGAIGLTAVVAPAILAVGIDSAVHPAQAACLPGAKVDKSTATQAKSKIEKAGFRQVHDLKKGCDNYWHGMATKDGNQTHVVLSPKGEVMTEGD